MGRKACEQCSKELYENEQLSVQQIADRLRMSYGTLYRRLQDTRVKKRSISEAAHARRGNHVSLSPKALRFLDGELLGDGCYISQSKWSALYTHSTASLSYLQWLHNYLSGFGLVCSRIYKNMRADPRGKFFAKYSLTTKAYAELKNQYDRWYKAGRKEIPGDLSLTPVTVRQWYIGDGSLGRSTGTTFPTVTFATMCFSITEIESLIEQLRTLGIEATRQPKRNILYIQARSTRAFFDYIGECPEGIINSYGYKWPTCDFDEPRRGRRGEKNGRSRLTESDVLYIRKSAQSSAKLAKELGVYETTVRKARRGETWRWLNETV